MKKFIATFGSNQLKEFDVRAMNVMLIIEGKNENEARKPLFEEPFNGKFSFSYPYEKAEEFKKTYGMKEYTMEQLLKLRR